MSYKVQTHRLVACYEYIMIHELGCQLTILTCTNLHGPGKT
uniref:Uncharacterized protein n=1 Tax=Arundo donax TaxID=35708 RepID=A0A0A8YWY7_ARUDO